MPGVKPGPDDGAQRHDELELNLACVGGGSRVQERAAKRVKSHSVANQKEEQAKETPFALLRRSGVSTRLGHSAMQSKDSVKDKFQACDCDPGEPCSTSGHQKQGEYCSNAGQKLLVNAPRNDSLKWAGLGRQPGPPTQHLCHSCMETRDSDDLRLRSGTLCERRFLCGLCPEVFPNSAALAEHSRTHVDCPLFICDRCSITFSNRAHFDRHVEEHGVEQLHNCHLRTEELFADELKLRVHNEAHTGESFSCGSGEKEVAVYVQSSGSFTLQDINELRQCEDLSTTDCTCHVCMQTFDCESGLREHIWIEHSAELFGLQDKKLSAEADDFVDEPPSTMERDFSETFGDADSLGDDTGTDLCCEASERKAEHGPEDPVMETASGAQKLVPRACHLCPEELDDDKSLFRHIRTDHRSGNKLPSSGYNCPEKKFACEHCPKRFRTKGHLNRHLLTHTGETPFQCHLCPAKFSQKGDLHRHVDRHMGHKRFLCPFCPKRFVVKASLDTHLCTHTGVRPFLCNRCPASFSARDNLRKHINSHIGLRPYACDKCPSSFARLADLKRHGRVHTGERPFSCGSCSKTFTRGHLLQDHVVAAHRP